jgi:hypothetical protein|tara:strand:- start:231 stop:383 length:153 start_codon:yes stop_codon:yes gene_type:complete
MESFGIIGMSIGTIAFVFSLTAQARISKLEKQLKAVGVLDEGFDSEKKEE